MEVVSYSLYPSTLEKVENFARERRISRSAAARSLLTKGLEAFEEGTMSDEALPPQIHEKQPPEGR